MDLDREGSWKAKDSSGVRRKEMIIGVGCALASNVGLVKEPSDIFWLRQMKRDILVPSKFNTKKIM